MKNRRRIYFYSLTDPETSEICYIGQTTKLYRRLNQHLLLIEDSYYKVLWIQNLVKLEMLPIMTVVEEKEMDDLELWHNEQKIIIDCWNSGHPLLNSDVRDNVCPVNEWIFRLENSKFNLKRKVFINNRGLSVVEQMY